jgi:hypothetical protein
MVAFETGLAFAFGVNPDLITGIHIKDNEPAHAH